MGSTPLAANKNRQIISELKDFFGITDLPDSQHGDKFDVNCSCEKLM